MVWIGRVRKEERSHEVPAGLKPVECRQPIVHGPGGRACKYNAGHYFLEPVKEPVKGKFARPAIGWLSEV